MTPTNRSVQEAADRIRRWLVQTYQYTASTIELNEVLVREIGKVTCDQAEGS